MNKNIGFAITGSFCTHNKILKYIEELKFNNYNILPIFSFAVSNEDTRFGTALDFKNKITEISGNKPIVSLQEAEPIGPNNLIDILVIAPCTGNTLAKLASAITDTPVTMVAKAHLRNNKPIVIGVSSNDLLGLNLKNIATLLNTKNIFFVPFGQDDYIKKPKSLIAHWNLLKDTIEKALIGEQLQPILKEYN